MSWTQNVRAVICEVPSPEQVLEVTDYINSFSLNQVVKKLWTSAISLPRAIKKWNMNSSNQKQDFTTVFVTLAHMIKVQWHPAAVPVGVIQVHPQTVHDVGYSQSRGARDSCCTVDQHRGTRRHGCVCEHKVALRHTAQYQHDQHLDIFYRFCEEARRSVS